MKSNLQPPPDSGPDEAAPSRPRFRFSAKQLGVASTVAAAGAVVTLFAATQVAVHATSDPADDPASAPIAAESTDEDAPEKAEEVAPPAEIPAAYDSLAGDEVSYVRFLVSQTDDFAAGVDVFDGEGLQYLSTDVADPSFYDDGQRRLSLLYYDYGTEELVTFLVNVTTGAVESVERGQGAQPAPTEAETVLAWELLLADLAAGADLGSEYEAITGGTLAPDTAGLDLTAHSFTTDAASFGAESCGIDRCVQLLAQVDGGAFLTTSTYVVNLSTKTVLPVS